MVLQLTPLRIPSLTTDYSAETNAAARLGQTIAGLPGEFRKQQELQAQKENLKLLGQDISQGNYSGAAARAFSLGDIGGGATIAGLGQKAQEQRLTEEAYKSSPFGGGGGAALLGGPSPRASLIQNESGGRWDAQNNATGAGGMQGHFGRLQFGQARLQEAAAAGAIPQGTTPQQFMQSPELQKSAEAWHFSDIDQAIKQNGYDRLVGQPINGVPVTVDGLRAVAHLGGVQGMKRFVETGGRYNPADVNGTRLSDYFARHGGGAQQPVQVAENEADVQRYETQMGQGQQPAPVQLAQAPAQAGVASDTPAPGAQPVQGFAIPQGQASALPPNDPFPQVSNEQIIQVLRNPRSPAGDKAIAQQLFASRQAYSAENAPDKREQVRLETEKKAQEVEKLKRENAGILTPEQEQQKIRIARAGRPINEPALPPGYKAIRDPEGNIERLEPIPGSKAEQEATAAAEKKVKADRIKGEVGTTVGNALDDIDRLTSSAFLPTSGALGARVAAIPGTAAYDVSQALTTIGANISFSQIQQMREASPTGGALGMITDNEHKLLTNSYAALSQSQSEAQFKTNLGRVRATFERIVHGRTLTGQERKTGGPMTMERAKGLREEAAAAIAGGAPREAVMKRLKEDYGITPEGL